MTWQQNVAATFMVIILFILLLWIILATFIIFEKTFDNVHQKFLRWKRIRAYNKEQAERNRIKNWKAILEESE